MRAGGHPRFPLSSPAKHLLSLLVEDLGIAASSLRSVRLTNPAKAP
jgi:hypothetical protein